MKINSKLVWVHLEAAAGAPACSRLWVCDQPVVSHVSQHAIEGGSFKPVTDRRSVALFGCARMFCNVLALCLMLKAGSALAQNPATNPVTRANSASITNWMPRHEAFVAEAKKGGIDLLFMGDSITDRWRNRGSNVWKQFYAGRHAANFGISGDRTQHVLWRIEHGELDGISPKVIVLMIGTNNSKTDSADQIAEGVEKIVAETRQRCPASKILLLAIFPRNKPPPADKPGQMDTINRANERIAKLDDGKFIRFLNINDKFLGPDGKVPAEIMPDFLHPDEKGYRIWADAMEPLLKQMLN